MNNRRRNSSEPNRIRWWNTITEQNEIKRIPSRLDYIKRGLLCLLLLCFCFLCFLIVGEIRSMTSKAVSFEPVINTGVGKNPAMKNYTNIALFGVDSREDNKEGGQNRSDTIMVISISHKTGAVKIFSLMRDTYLKITEDSYGKANGAYSFGGAKGAVDMINRNLDLNITEFITVGFLDLADMIDVLGGLDLTITKEEAGYMNDYLHDMKGEMGSDSTPVTLEGDEETVHVTGIQAVAYARVRYTEGDDFKRAERAQTVVKEMVKKCLELVRKGSYRKVYRIGKYFMKSSYHSINASDLRKLLKLALKVKKYMELEEKRNKKEDGIDRLIRMEKFPREKNRINNAWIDKSSCILAAPLKENIRWLHKYLFDEEDYEVSPEAMEISDYLRTFYQ